MVETQENDGNGLFFMTSWVCRYTKKGKNGAEDVVHILYRGRFHGENEAWYLKDAEENQIYELIKINTYEEKGITIYRVGTPKMHNLRFTYEKIKKYARRKETTFMFHRSDFVPK